MLELEIGSSPHIEISRLLCLLGLQLVLGLQVALVAGQPRRKDWSLDILLFDDGPEEGLSIEPPILVAKLIEHFLPFLLAHHQIVDIQFFHHVVILLPVNGFAPTPIYLEGFLELVELVLEDQMDLLGEVFSRTAESTLKLQSREMDVFTGHQIHELGEREVVFLTARQPADDFCLVLVDIVPILSNYFLQLFDAQLPLLPELLEVLIEVSPILVVLDEGMFELV